MNPFDLGASCGWRRERRHEIQQSMRKQEVVDRADPLGTIWVTGSHFVPQTAGMTDVRAKHAIDAQNVLWVLQSVRSQLGGLLQCGQCQRVLQSRPWLAGPRDSTRCSISNDQYLGAVIAIVNYCSQTAYTRMKAVLYPVRYRCSKPGPHAPSAPVLTSPHSDPLHAAAGLRHSCDPIQ